MFCRCFANAFVNASIDSYGNDVNGGDLIQIKFLEKKILSKGMTMAASALKTKPIYRLGQIFSVSIELRKPLPRSS